MAKRGRAGNYRQRRQILALYFQDLYSANRPYPTVTELARKLGVTTPTIYHDLEVLRYKLGAYIIPVGLKLGGRKYARERRERSGTRP